jgi:hypothetical protein
MYKPEGWFVTMPQVCVNETKEKAMYYDGENKFDLNLHRIEHLSERLSDINAKKWMEGQRFFGLADDSPPMTVKEMLDRITSGKYILNAEKYGEQNPCYLTRYIRWRDPAVKEDKEGFKVFEEKLSKATTDTRDIINIKDADIGLKALQDFEAATFH